MTPVIEAEVEQKVQRPALPKADPCILVILGARGDLPRRKLIPALYDLCGEGCMTACFEVVGTGRTQMTDEQFRASVHGAARTSKDVRGSTGTNRAGRASSWKSQSAAIWNRPAPSMKPSSRSSARRIPIASIII